MLDALVSAHRFAYVLLLQALTSVLVEVASLRGWGRQNGNHMFGQEESESSCKLRNCV